VDGPGTEKRKADGQVEELLRKAILGKNLVEINCEGGTRVLEPHLVAHNYNGHILLNGWFVRDDNNFSEEGWQDYRLADISELKILPQTFPEARTGYNPLDSDKYANIQCCL
jgi:hypothetical protein